MRLLLYVLLLILGSCIVMLSGCGPTLVESNYSEAENGTVALLEDEAVEPAVEATFVPWPSLQTELTVYPVGTTEIKLLADFPDVEVDDGERQWLSYDWTLEVWQDDKWREVPGPFMETIPDGQVSWDKKFTIDLTKYDYEFAPGQYRIVKELSPDTDMYNGAPVYLAAEFSIE